MFTDREQELDTAIYSAYDDQGAYDPIVPEKTLLVAILLNALNDLHKDGPEAMKAVEYFLSPDEDYLFSFLSVCNHLDFDPKRILKFSGLYNSMPA